MREAEQTNMMPLANGSGAVPVTTKATARGPKLIAPNRKHLILSGAEGHDTTSTIH